MTSAPLLTSLLFFTGILGVSAVLLSYSIKSLIYSGLAVIVAMALSSLNLVYGSLLIDIHASAYGSWAEGFLRFFFPTLVLALANPNGRADTALLQTLCLWACLDIIFVVQFGEIPQVADYLREYMRLYLLVPATAALLSLTLCLAFRSVRKD